MNLRARLIPPGAYHPAPELPQTTTTGGALPVRTGVETVNDHQEVFTNTIDLPKTATTIVYRTQRMWRAIDVYVDTRLAAFSSPASVLSVFVWAITGGLRSLVASGRTRNSGTFVDARPLRLASSRIPLAESFEIELSYNVTEPQPQRVAVSIIAADEGIPVDQDVDGMIPMSQTLHLTTAVALITPVDRPQLLAVTATAAVGARWLHVHDVSSVAPGTLNGRAPVFAFGLGAAASGGAGPAVPVSPVLQDRRLFAAGLTICTSTTAAVTTLAAIGDAAIGGFVR